ncbi:MaoC family dehydratase N-terminal domain-containing protein [Sphingomonas bacterium]|uniref:MaoC family dehydratase N-terminal domain-containing protein n=1 Tax=Sphingomonas bacterium TaxID=1895847 RepID=UPI00157604B1|nr:MaoC family dehydratase N-terminal domain-containing protein [Sphingomonas bacterium]
MSDNAVAATNRGLFDRSTKGLTVAPVFVPIERGRIQFFAQVLGITDPVHIDVNAARANGYPDLVAPPSFYMVIEAAANDELKRTGQPSTFDRIGCDYRYLLHGDESYEYIGPIFAGDEVSLTTTVVDFYDKKGGAMEFVTLRSSIEHADRGVLVRATRNLLHRLG